MARKSRQATQQAAALGTQVPTAPVVKEKAPSKYKTAIYARLSVYDLGRDRNDTMENQIELLEHFVSQQSDLNLSEIYIDNGWTGTTFARPEFQRLLDDAKIGRINCIVVKDLSRFGRNYLETGYYLQKMFPLYNVRFISVNDGYDSLTADPDSMAISMKNIVNDYYSKDISRKVSSSFDLKRSQGVYSWGHPVYGYVRNKEDPSKLEIDEEVSPYVHLMFQWALDGVPIGRIATNLTEMQAPTYQRLAHQRKNGRTKRKGSDVWTNSTVKQILLNQTYAGDFVCNKSYFRKYDPSNGRWIPEDEWIIIPDTHPAYIDREDYFRLKQQLLSLRKKRSQVRIDNTEIREQMPDKFKDLLFCGECQRHMRIRRGYGKSLYKAYDCKGEENQFHAPHKSFTMNADTLEIVVLWQLNLQIKCAIDIDDMLHRLSLEDTAKQLKARRQAELNMLKGKLADIKKKRSKTFEDFSEALIDEDVYRMKMDKLASELDTAHDLIAIAEKRLHSVDTYFTIDNKWLRTFVETGALNEMTPELIKQLIDRIDIYSDKRIQITFSYSNWMEPLLDCYEEAQIIEAEKTTE